MERENKDKKHDSKRTRIQISLYAKDKSLMKTKYGKILTATEAKEILLTGELKVITRNIDPLLPEVRTELRRIGNNINQLANLANAKKEIPALSMLKLQLMEIHELIDQLYRIKP
ncbi:MAG: MobC family plasmid mobilization relaxosome protein [Crocinitomicaceae bacterium]|nr:MobC family plasmid mobilization relaxosome protein [Crocinitomicaceae bacterium]MCF8433208.1 MobC family plasmid mobilization relaxosome protein [Crocinitomicaceae bacterium]